MFLKKLFLKKRVLTATFPELTLQDKTKIFIFETIRICARQEPTDVSLRVKIFSPEIIEYKKVLFYEIHLE